MIGRGYVEKVLLLITLLFVWSCSNKGSILTMGYSKLKPKMIYNNDMEKWNIRSARYVINRDSFQMGTFYDSKKGKNLFVTGYYHNQFDHSPLTSTHVVLLNEGQIEMLFDDHHYLITNQPAQKISIQKIKQNRGLDLVYYSKMNDQISVLDSNGKNIKLVTLLSKDKDNILIFWANNCQSCLNLMDKIYHEKTRKENIIFLMENEAIKVGKKYTDKYNDRLQFYYANKETCAFFGQNGSPYLIWINKDGRINYDNNYGLEE